MTSIPWRRLPIDTPPTTACFTIELECVRQREKRKSILLLSMLHTQSSFTSKRKAYIFPYSLDRDGQDSTRRITLTCCYYKFSPDFVSLDFCGVVWSQFIWYTAFILFLNITFTSTICFFLYHLKLIFFWKTETLRSYIVWTPQCSLSIEPYDQGGMSCFSNFVWHEFGYFDW